MVYFNSTSAPASSKAFWIPSASSLATPSLTVLGAPSTISFASFKPKPVSSFTALTTFNLAAPAAFSTTSNSDFSSAESPPPPPAGAPATATAAAAAGSIP